METLGLKVTGTAACLAMIVLGLSLAVHDLRAGQASGSAGDSPDRS